MQQLICSNYEQKYLEFFKIPHDFMLVFSRLLLIVSEVGFWGFTRVIGSPDTGYFLLGDRLGCLGTDKVPEDCRKFINAGCAFEQSYQRAIMLSPFLYRWWPTKDYKTMTRSTDVLTYFALKHMEQKMHKIKQMSSSVEEVKQPAVKVDFLTSLLLSDELSSWQVAGIVVDMFLGGLGPVSAFSSCYLWVVTSYQELMSGEAAKEHVTPVPSWLLTYFRFQVWQCASCGQSIKFLFVCHLHTQPARKGLWDTVRDDKVYSYINNYYKILDWGG